MPRFSEADIAWECWRRTCGAAHVNQARPGGSPGQGSALARLIALLGLVDDVDPALSAYELVVAVAAADRLEGMTNLHGPDLRSCRGRREMLVSLRRAPPRQAGNPRTRGPACMSERIA